MHIVAHCNKSWRCGEVLELFNTGTMHDLLGCSDLKSSTEQATWISDARVRARGSRRRCEGSPSCRRDGAGVAVALIIGKASSSTLGCRRRLATPDKQPECTGWLPRSENRCGRRRKAELSSARA